MPYGLHWEWRGFGRLEASVRHRITQLPPAYAVERTVRDRYLWRSGMVTNIKLRSWPSGSSLKFKRLVRRDTEHGVQLWSEHVDEDFAFPLHGAQIRQLGNEVGLELPATLPRDDPVALIAELEMAGLSIITVEKVRRLYRWESGERKVFVELARVLHPERLETVGIEDAMGLAQGSALERVTAAKDAVLEGRDELRLPGTLETSSYLELLARWSGEN